MAQAGKIKVISGCMFAGKTTELLRVLRREKIADRDVELFTPETDTRNDVEKVGSHDGVEETATVVNPETDLDVLYKKSRTKDVIGIDEGNFFTTELPIVLQQIAEDGTDVVVCGLDQTFRGEGFSPMNELLAIADDVDKLTAICENCGRTATMTQRLIDGEPASEDAPTVHVGGDETYEARCRSCHTLN